MSYMIDTNIFLEVLLSRKRKQECKAFLRLVATGRIRGILTDFSLYSIMLIMASYKKYTGLKTFLSTLTAYKGLLVYNCTLDDKIKCVEIFEEEGLDVDDSIQYTAALSLIVEALISFDEHFDGLKIPRKEPLQITQAT